MSLDLLESVGEGERAIVRRLISAGMSAVEARRKSRLFETALDRLAEFAAPAAADSYLVFVPGRIEVLGKHTDYAGGRSLLAAVERGFCFAAAPRNDDTIHVVDASSGLGTSFDFSPELTAMTGHWSNYTMTVARRVARNFSGPLRGADIAFASDLPPAAGMSSSSALMIGTFSVLAELNQLADRAEYQANLGSPEALAGYLATIENGQSFGSLTGDRGVGTFGGSEDHTAICCCRPGQFQLYSFCPVRREQAIPLPEGYVLAVAASGVQAEKTGDAMARYNRAAQLVAALLELWRATTGRDDRSLADAIHSSADAADVLRQIVADYSQGEFDSVALLPRLEQFLGENERVIPAAIRALAAGDLESFGALVDESQQMAEQLLQNQVPQTAHLARSARRRGAAAASAFGAGFGGSVWALIRAEEADSFLAAWSARYRERFPAEAAHSSFFLTAAGPGLVEL